MERKRFTYHMITILLIMFIVSYIGLLMKPDIMKEAFNNIIVLISAILSSIITYNIRE